MRGFKAGVANGHHLVNRSADDAVFIEIGTRTPRERANFPDINLIAVIDENGVRYDGNDGGRP